MKITISETTTETTTHEIEIETPAYYKIEGSMKNYYAFTDKEDNGIEVSILKTHDGKENCWIKNCMFIGNVLKGKPIPITEDEFDDALDKAFEIFRSKTLQTAETA